MNTKQYLLDHGVKPSVQRLALMNYLLTHKTHPNVEEMYAALSGEIPTLSRTTVYNTMKLFVEHGVALALNIEEKNLRFDGDVMPHGHFLCKKCGKLYDFCAQSGNIAAEKWFDVPAGFELEDVQVYCKGICNNCK